MQTNNLKIALVADWITHFGGAERVFIKLMEMYPEADIYTSVFFPVKELETYFQGRRVFTSFIQHIPYFNRKHKLCMLLRPLAFSRFDFSEYDLVISSSSAETKGIRIKKPKAKSQKPKAMDCNNLEKSQLPAFSILLSAGNPIHICYCHTPTRYLWSHSEEYRNFLEFGWLNWLAKLIIPPAFTLMKKWDFKAAQRPDVFIANSKTVQERIQKYYKRESTVVYPFFASVSSSSGERVHCEAGTSEDPGIQANILSQSEPINPSSLASRFRRNDGLGYFICLGRIVPYKRFDIAIEACNQLGWNLKIFTNTRNSESERLQKLSGPTIEWIFSGTDEEVAEGLAGAQAFIMPQEEDFGIVALEAMSHGTPVIAYGCGGATETVIDGKTGVLFPEQTIESLGDALIHFGEIFWNKDVIQSRANEFSEERFVREFTKVVEEVSFNTKDRRDAGMA